MNRDQYLNAVAHTLESLAPRQAGGNKKTAGYVEFSAGVSIGKPAAGGRFIRLQR